MDLNENCRAWHSSLYVGRGSQHSCSPEARQGVRGRGSIREVTSGLLVFRLLLGEESRERGDVCVDLLGGLRRAGGVTVVAGHFVVFSGRL